VFLKYFHVEQLNLLLRGVLARVVVMQAYTRGWLGARRYRKVKQRRSHGALVIQSGTRSSLLLFFAVFLSYKYSKHKPTGQ
jgi:myosin-3